MNDSNDTKEIIRQLIRNGDLKQAEERARVLVQESPSDANAKVILGRILGMQERYQEAAELFQEALQQDNQNLDALLDLALTFELVKKYDDAIGCYQKALSLGSKQSFIHYRIGRIYANHDYTQQSSEMARNHFRWATTDEEPIEEAFLQFAGLEGPKRALYILQNGLKYFPKSSRLYDALARVHFYRLNAPEACLATITLAKENGIETDDLHFLGALAQLEQGNYDEARAFLSSINVEDKELRQAIGCFVALSAMEKAEFTEAAVILQNLISEDFANRLQYTAHFLLMCCHLRQGQNENAEAIFVEIPQTEEIYDLSIYASPLGGYSLDKYFLEALNGLVANSLKEDVVGKARGFRGIYNATRRGAIEGNADWELIKEDLTIALKAFPNDVNYNNHLGQVLFQQHDWVAAAKHYFLAQLNTDDEQYSELDFLDKIYENKTRLGRFLKEIDELLDESRSKWSERFARFFLGQVVTFLHSKKEYARVIELVSKFDYALLLKAGVLFEVAYAYVEAGDKKRGRSYYSAYLRDVKEDAAVCNNLGLLYGDDDNLKEAEKMFLRALALDPNNDKAKGNLLRVQQKIQEFEKRRQAIEKAVHLYAQENITIRRAIAKLYQERTSDDLILCNRDHAASVLGVRPNMVDERMDELIQKKYFDEVTNHGLTFRGKVLRLNPSLIQEVQKEIELADEEKLAEQIAAELTSSSLDQKFGYNRSLLVNLTHLHSKDLSVMIERDLREAVVALATQSYKSALVLCGSIVEAILLDCLMVRKDSAVGALERILAKDNRSIKPEDKQLERWDLNRLLDIAHEEKLISENLYHWGHGIRGFRNLIHPGVEQRTTMEVSRDNAEIAWKVLKCLLNELAQYYKSDSP